MGLFVFLRASAAAAAAFHRVLSLCFNLGCCGLSNRFLPFFKIFLIFSLVPDSTVAMRTLADLVALSDEALQSSKRCNQPEEIADDLRTAEMLLVDTMGFSMDETPVLGGSYR